MGPFSLTIRLRVWRKKGSKKKDTVPSLHARPTAISKTPEPGINLSATGHEIQFSFRVFNAPCAGNF